MRQEMIYSNDSGVQLTGRSRSDARLHAGRVLGRVRGAARLVFVGAIVATTMVALPTTASATGKPFVVLNIEGISGAEAAPAAAETAGFTAVARYLNSHGGVLGHPVDVVTVNDNGDPTTAVSDLDSYLSDHAKPNVVFPGTADTEGAALLPILAEDHLLSFHGSALDAYTDVSQSPEAFTILGPVSQQAAAMVNFIKSKGYKSAGILSEGISFTQEETAPLQQALKAAGITSTVENFPATALDVTPEMQALQSHSPQVLVVEALNQSAGYALTARATLGWKVPVVGDPAFGDSNVSGLVPRADLSNVSAVIFKCNQYLPSAARPIGLKTFLKYASGLIKGQVASLPINLTATGWDGMLLLAAAAEQARSVATPALVKALTHMTNTANSLYVIFGGIAFTPRSHENVATSSSDYVVAPVGPVVGGFVKPLS